MDNSKKIVVKDPLVLFSSLLGVGLFPYAPGTIASLVTLPFIYLLSFTQHPITILIVFIALITPISVYLCDRVQKKYKIHDPGWIVIDEVIGMATTALFCKNLGLINLFLIFILFRFFDILKFWPASFIDKKVMNGFGTIFDDIISGIYAGIIIFALNHFINI